MQTVSRINAASVIHGCSNSRPKRSLASRAASGQRMSEDLTHISYYHVANFTGSTTTTKKRHALSVAEQGRSTVAERATTETEQIVQLCDSGLPNPELCDLVQQPPPEMSVFAETWSRGRWLLGLLVLQSMSSFVLDSYQQLLKDHLVVTLFLTMLVGAGGNAGNQSAIKVIRGLATGSIQPTAAAIKQTMMQQGMVGFLLGAGLSVGGFVRVYATNGSIVNAFAISMSLFLIVMTSVLTGTALPFGLQKLGVDPANAGTSVQVVMDIAGCFITCATCTLILDQLARGLQPLTA
eukprot:jgi/Botrbrau1/20152/Bobra.0173s0054.1